MKTPLHIPPALSEGTQLVYDDGGDCLLKSPVGGDRLLEICLVTTRYRAQLCAVAGGRP